MDQVDQELSRIIRLAGRELVNANWECGLTSDPNVDGTTNSFLKNLLSRMKIEGNLNDTALHWMMGTHVSATTLKIYIDMKGHYESYMIGESKEVSPEIASVFETEIWPYSLDCQTSKGATPMHVAVFRNSWYAGAIVKMLLDSQHVNGVNLASIPMSCGSYPLHVLCGHNTTIQTEVFDLLLRSYPSAVLKEDANGDNPLSLLWKNVLRFRWAVAMEKGETSIDDFEGGLSWITIITPGQFLLYSLKMMASFREDYKSDEECYEQIHASIHEICRIPRCPALLLRLALTQKSPVLSGDAFTLDGNGMLPLHHAVQVLAANDDFVSSYVKGRLQSVVEILIQENPSGLTTTDNFGRLPLHYALDCGCTKEDALLTMIQLYPESLRYPDPISGLYPFMLVANKTVAIPRPVDGGRPAEWKQDVVPMSYLLLQVCPDVIQYQFQAGAGFHCT